MTTEEITNELEALRRRVRELEAQAGEARVEESLFRSLFSDSPVGVYVAQDGKFLYVNPRLQRDTGYAESELLGSDTLELVVPEDRAVAREHAVSMLRGERTVPYEFRSVDKGGRTRSVMGSLASIQFGKKRAALGYYMDITDDKSLQGALRQRGDLYGVLVQSLGDAIAANVGVMDRAWRMRDAIARLPKAKLVERQDITEDLTVMKLEPEIEFAFKAGQYCTLGLGSVERAYSIVSAPHEPVLEIFVELVPPPDGALTPMMWKLNVGDSMSIRPRAKGIFTMEERYRHHLMVATVTGIAPFLSTIRSYLHRGGQGHKFYVLQGASYLNEFTYGDEMQELASRHPDTVVYVPAVSRPAEEINAGWQGVKGRVNTIVDEYVEKLGLEPDTTLVYACGHPGMIEDLGERLSPRGFRIKEERYWKQ